MLYFIRKMGIKDTSMKGECEINTDADEGEHIKDNIPELLSTEKPRKQD